MKSLLLVSAFLAALTSASGVAFADTWSPTISAEHGKGGHTSLKIVEPHGLHVVVQTPSGPHEDTIPTVVNLPDQDAFLMVTVTAANGEKWAQKVEIHAHKQTRLQLEHRVATAAAGPQKKARKYIARAANFTSRCKTRTPIKFEFLNAEGQTAFEQVVAPGADAQFQAEEGSYDVRAYIQENGAWRFMTTSKQQVNSDSFKVGFGCARPGSVRVEWLSPR